MKSIITAAAVASLGSLALVVSSCNRQEPAAVVATEVASPVTAYPLEVCLVSGEELGSMGEPTVLVHEGQEVKFCCDSCEPKFKADPEKYLSKLRAAE
jgi:hypothetical protein